MSKNVSLKECSNKDSDVEANKATTPQVMIAIRDVNKYEAKFDDDDDSTYYPSSISS